MTYDLLIETRMITLAHGRVFHSSTRISIDGGKSWIIAGRVLFPKNSISSFSTTHREVTWDDHERMRGRALVFGVDA